MKTIKFIVGAAVFSLGLFATSYFGVSTASTVSASENCPIRLCDCVRDPETGQCRPPQ